MANIVFSQIGWDEGFAFPVANAENKALEAELQKKQKEKSKLKNEIREHKDRIQALSDYLKDVRQELVHTQELCRAVEKEAESEVHFRATSEREAGHLSQEMAQLGKELAALSDRKKAQQNDIVKATQRMEQLKRELNWDQRTLATWLEDSARKDEDTMAILRYAQQDESRIKELFRFIEKAALEVSQRCKALDCEHTRTVTAQIGLDKTTEILCQAHTERQELIRQWENTIAQMRKRDQELQQCMMVIPGLKQQVRERQDVIKEKTLFLENQVENNKECEQKMERATRLAERLREEVHEQESHRAHLQDEFEGLRATVQRTATDVEAKKSQVAAVKKDIQTRQNQLRSTVLRNTALQERLKSVSESVLSVDEVANQMEQLLKEEEQNKNEVEMQVHRLRVAQPRIQQELQALKAKEKHLMADISANRIVLKTLNEQRIRAEQTCLKKREMVHSKDFQVQLLQRKMVCVEVEENNMARQTLRHEEAVLEKSIEQEKKTSSMLSQNLKKLQVEVNIVKKESEKIETQKKDLIEKIDELNLINDTSNRELKKLRFNKQDAMVEDNVLKLQVKRLSSLLCSKADKVLSLEKHKLQQQATMRERELQIAVHRELLHKQLKMADQERQRLSCELTEKLCKTDKMRKKFETMILSMETPEGEAWSPEYYLVKIVREKEELQLRGDELVTKISKKEEENQALENTLHAITYRNVEYRRVFTNLAKWGEDYQHQLSLERERRAAEAACLRKKRQTRELQEDVQVMSHALEELHKEVTTEHVKTNKMRLQTQTLQKELSSQKEKLNRVTKQLSRLMREIRTAQGSQGKTAEESDIDLSELKDFSKKVNSMLLEAMQENTDLRSVLETKFQEANLRLPQPAPVSAVASQSSSKPPTMRISVCVKSPTSSIVSTRASTMQFPHLKKVNMGLQLGAANPRWSISLPRESKHTRSSSSSSSSSQQ